MTAHDAPSPAAHPPSASRDDAPVAAPPVAGSRFSSRIYDPFLWLAERAGMAERRRALVAQARGAVLEIGSGTGLNVAHYPDGLERLVLCEPDEHMAARLADRAARHQPAARVVHAQAEELPFEDGAFDTVVSTLVLCTVGDPARSLGELRRVLRPDGTLLFLEHVRSEDARLARWQERLQGPWASFADGCDCNRPTVALLREHGYDVEVTERASWRRMPPIVRPLVAGRAQPTPAAA